MRQNGCLRQYVGRPGCWRSQSLAVAAASPLADAARQQDRAAIRALIKQRGDVNAPQADGATALHWAAHWDDMESVELLLSAGAAVNAKNDYGVTPLSLAGREREPGLRCSA